MNNKIYIPYFRITRTVLALMLFSFLLSGCATCSYGFHEKSTISPDVKTFRVNFFENRARYVNPQLAPQLTEKLKQKIIGNTRLRQTNADDAGFDISGYVADYTPSTSGISNGAASTNRLSVTFHVILKNNVETAKSFEADITNSFDFPATQTLAEAESSLNDKILRNTIDGIFNKIFVNW